MRMSSVCVSSVRVNRGEGVAAIGDHNSNIYSNMKNNTYILHEGTKNGQRYFVAASGFTRESQNRKTGDMIQIWIMLADPLVIVTDSKTKDVQTKKLTGTYFRIIPPANDRVNWVLTCSEMHVDRWASATDSTMIISENLRKQLVSLFSC